MIINNYTQDNSLSLDDRLLGIDSGNNEKTKTYTLESLKDFIQSRHLITHGVPELDEVVAIITSTNETYLKFTDVLVNNFVVQVTPDTTTEIGDKLFLFMKNDGENQVAVTFSGSVNNVMCGDTEDTYYLNNPNMVCIELIFDGQKFTGIDNC